MAKIRAQNEIKELIDFLDNSPTAWHAVANIAAALQQHGFSEVKEADKWHLEPGKAYYVVRNGSSLCAFIVPKHAPQTARVVASHTDSPALKLKPNAEYHKENMLMLGVELYGSPMLSSWLNRDLGIAGRALLLDGKGSCKEELVCLDDLPVVIPQLAIHLDRNVNEGGPALNKQEHMAALAAIEPAKTSKGAKQGATYIQRRLKTLWPKHELLSFDLFLYPLEKARLLGEQRDLLAAYRIDNLASAHAALQGIVNTRQAAPSLLKMAVFWDNEEIGSTTAQGAGSPFLAHVIERICLASKLAREDYFRLLDSSLCASVDQAHAFHPGYPEKHEPNHLALLNRGIVLKTSAQQRYASDARTSGVIAALCKQHDIPYQKYVSRGDIPCGTTVGPIHAGATGMPTVDIGCAQLSMHGARELMGTTDHQDMCRLLKAFLN